MDDLRDEELWTLLAILTARHPSLIEPLSLLCKRVHKAVRQTLPTGLHDEFRTSETFISVALQLRSNEPKIDPAAKDPPSTDQQPHDSTSPTTELSHGRNGRTLDLTIGYPIGGGGIWVEGWFEVNSGSRFGENAVNERTQGGMMEGDGGVGWPSAGMDLGSSAGGYLIRGKWEDVLSDIGLDPYTLLLPFTHLTINQALTVSPPPSIHPPRPIQLPATEHVALSAGMIVRAEVEAQDVRPTPAKLSPTSVPFVPSPCSITGAGNQVMKTSGPTSTSTRMDGGFQVAQLMHQVSPPDVRSQQQYQQGPMGRAIGCSLALGQANAYPNAQQLSQPPGRMGPAPDLNSSSKSWSISSPDQPYSSSHEFGPRLGHPDRYASNHGAGGYPGVGTYQMHPPYAPHQACGSSFSWSAPQQQYTPRGSSDVGTMGLPMTPCPSIENKSAAPPIADANSANPSEQKGYLLNESTATLTPVTPTDITVSISYQPVSPSLEEAKCVSRAGVAVSGDKVTCTIVNRRLTEEERRSQNEQLRTIIRSAEGLRTVEFRSGMGLGVDVWEAIADLPLLQRLSLSPPLPHPAHASPTASTSTGAGGVPSIPRFNPFFLQRSAGLAHRDDENKTMLDRLVEFRAGNLGIVGTKNLICHLHRLSGLAVPPILRVLDVSTVFLDAPMCTAIAELGSAGQLEELILSTTGTKFFDAGLKEILDGCAGLKRFELREIQGRLTKKAWAGIASWPKGLANVVVRIEELGPHHTWFLDHLQSIHHLPLEQLESLTLSRTSPEICRMPIKPRNLHVPEMKHQCEAQTLPETFLAAMTAIESCRLKKLDLIWWKMDEDMLTSIAKVCPDLEDLRLQIDFPLQKLLSLNIWVALNDLASLSAMIAPAEQHVVEVKSKGARLPRQTKTATAAASSVPASGESPSRPAAVSRLPSYLAQKTAIADGAFPIERDVKKFARKTNRLTTLELIGHGVWTIIRPRSSGDREKKGQQALSADFVHAAVVYRDAWELGESVVPEGGYEDLPGQEVVSDVPMREEEESQNRRTSSASKTTAISASDPAPTPAEKHKAVAEWTMAATDFPKLASGKTGAQSAQSTHRPVMKGRGGKSMPSLSTPVAPVVKSKEIYKRSVLAGLAAGAGPAGGPPELPKGARGKPIMGSRAVVASIALGAAPSPAASRSDTATSIEKSKGSDKFSSTSSAVPRISTPAVPVPSGQRHNKTASIASRPAPFASSAEALAALSLSGAMSGSLVITPPLPQTMTTGKGGNMTSRAAGGVTSTKGMITTPPSSIPPKPVMANLPTPPASTRRSSSWTTGTNRSGGGVAGGRTVPGASTAGANGSAVLKGTKQGTNSTTTTTIIASSSSGTANQKSASTSTRTSASEPAKGASVGGKARQQGGGGGGKTKSDNSSSVSSGPTGGRAIGAR